MVQNEKVRTEFSQRLAQACKEAGLDEHGRGVAIAKALSISSKGVSKWFNAEALPRQEKMNSLAKLLGVDVVWLQHGKSNNKDHKSESEQDLTPRKRILLELFDELPDAEADELLKTLKEKKRMYDALYAELDEKKRRKKTG